MQKLGLTLFIAIILGNILSCSTGKKSITSDTMVFQEIKDVFTMQEKAWNSGDLDQFMQGYWNSEKMTFVGSKGVNYGWMTTLHNYKKNYPDTEAMGKLFFDIITLERISPDACYMIGKYTLVRKNDSPSGHFTLLWRYIDGKWVIVSDHTS